MKARQVIGHGIAIGATLVLLGASSLAAARALNDLGRLRELQQVAFSDLKGFVNGLDATPHRVLLSHQSDSMRKGTITMVLGEPCNSCEAAAAFWSTHLEPDLAPTTHLDVVVLGDTDVDQPLIAQLQSRGLSYRRLRIDDRQEFVIRTGAYGIPLTVFENGDGGACVVTGVPSALAATKCWSVLQPRALGATTVSFVERNYTDPVQTVAPRPTAE